MTAKELIKNNVHKQVFALVNSGYDIPSTAKELNISIALADTLYEIEIDNYKKNYTRIFPDIDDGKQYPTGEISSENESFKELYIDVYEEEYVITKMSKV